jgi:6-pyruvoyl-tetrahydropterin synthase
MARQGTVEKEIQAEGHNYILFLSLLSKKYEEEGFIV